MRYSVIIRCEIEAPDPESAVKALRVTSESDDVEITTDIPWISVES